jgi:transcription elongation GreA/GreB family factor
MVRRSSRLNDFYCFQPVGDRRDGTIRLMRSKEKDWNVYPLPEKDMKRSKPNLERIKKVDRPANIIAIEEARAHGDLSENAEYDAAKERQQFINGRISELGYKLGNADIIDPEQLPRDRVVFGSRVLLENTRPVKMSSISWSAPMNPTLTKDASLSPHRSVKPSSENVRTTKLRCRRLVASAYTSWWKFCDADIFEQQFLFRR